MVVLTTAAGYYLGADGSLDLVVLLHALLGTGVIASAASALNQVLERDSDARMLRTRHRPLPAGRMEVPAALGFGLVLMVLGTLYLAVAVNVLTAVVGFATLALYVGVYTPMKRRSSLCTIVGAVPGALPPVMGWTAATGALSAEAWVLFGVLFFWQLPHFLAIAWNYREDYARGGQPMLSVEDPRGGSTARQIVLYCMALLPVSLAPSLLSLTGSLYFYGALALGIAYLAAGLHAARERSHASAGLLLRVSVIYLPALLGLMTFDKVVP
ncbi:heme o synthase [Candidatus Binatia bacterium]|nr:heme o synthase [Candidatus Binatia bacterium]